MTDTEMTTDEILNSIRQMLSNEVSQENKSQPLPSMDELVDVFVLTPEMRVDEKNTLQEKMYRVLDKMNQQSTIQKLSDSWKIE